MKVYVFTLEGDYRGGCSVIAARSPYEAFGVLCEHDNQAIAYFSVNRCTELIDVSYGGAEPSVLVHNYYIE